MVCKNRGSAVEQELRPGTTVEAAIAVGELHQYRIALQQDEFFLLVVEQKQSDVQVAYYSPDGQRLQRIDYRWDGSERAPVIAEIAGYYRLEVRAVRAGKDARYILRPQAPQARKQDDETAVAAALASTKVKALITENTLDSNKKALTEAQQALELWRRT